MIVVLLAGASSIHTLRWANGLSDAGVQVHLVTQHPLLEGLHPNVKLHKFPYRGSLGYFTMVMGVRRLLRRIQPDIVNAHYASGYGTTARLVGYRPLLLSVWGSDVYIFPYKSALHEYVIRKNLLAADLVASTSHHMAEKVRDIAALREKVEITPFGVDVEAFDRTAAVECEGERDRNSVVIGTVKTMAHNYGIDTLLKAFSYVRVQLREEGDARSQFLHLRLVGAGPQTEELKQLAGELGILDVTTFAGHVSHAEVPNELSALDVYVALSRSESFGVAIIEAGAASRPVVVSDAGGLPEVTVDGETGFVVPREDPEAASKAILRLVRDHGLRARMGAAGRSHVVRNYSWPECVRNMLRVYEKTIEKA